MSRPAAPRDRLAAIDSELRSLYARYGQLMAERSALVSAPPPAAPPAATPPPGAPLSVPPFPAPPAAVPPPLAPPAATPTAAPGVPLSVPPPAAPPARDVPGWEASRMSVQALLLALGGLLLGAASIVFALVAWSRLGVGGRAAVLLAVTAVTLAAPVLLLPRRLPATAETVAAVGLLLALLDAYLLRRLGLAGGLTGHGYAAAVTAVLAAGWTGYGAALPALRGVRPAALALAQLPLPLLAAGAADPVPALALLATAAVDVGVLCRRPSLGVRVVALAGGTPAWAAGLAAALPAAYSPAPEPAAAVVALAGALAVGAAVLGAFGEAREAGVAVGVLALAAAAVAALRPALAGVPAGTLLAVALIAVVVAAGARWLGMRIAALALLVPVAGTSVAAAPAAGAVPLSTAAHPWAGVARPDLPSLPPILVLTTLLGAVATALVFRAPGRTAAAAAATLALLAPVALDLPYGATVGVLAAATLAAAGAAVRHRAAAAGALGLALLTVGWALAHRPATLAALAGVALVAAAVAGAASTTAVRAGAAATAVAALAAEAAAMPLAADLPRTAAGFALLGVAGAAAAASALLAGAGPTAADLAARAGRTVDPAARAGRTVDRAGPAPRVEALAVELTGAAAALTGVVLAGTSVDGSVAAFLVLGAILAGAALRPDRRALTWAAALSVQLAGWIWLAGAGVTAPEPYTLPLTAALHLLGAVRRTRDPSLSSWSAYGPALAITLVPSLLAAVAGTRPDRPLVLGVAALALLLAGARARLQAPLALAAGTLAVLALDQLGPAFAEVTAELPRWLPPALGGALLLAVGSTYEKRLAELRRARDAFAALD